MTAGWRLGGRPGDPVPPTLGCRKPVAQALGQGPYALAPSRGRTAPCSWGLCLLGGCAFAGLLLSALRERRAKPRVARPGVGTLGWGCQLLRSGGGWEGPGVEVGEEECGAQLVARWEGGKLFPVSPFSEDPSWLTPRGKESLGWVEARRWREAIS